MDKLEQLAIDRARELFGADHVNVQPHSGSQANFAVYYGLLNPGDTVLGMNLTDGGHLTHGSPVNVSGNYFNVLPYGVREDDELLDYDAMEKLAKEVHPKMIIGGTSAYSRIIDFERMAAVAHVYQCHQKLHEFHDFATHQIKLFHFSLPASHIL